VISAQSSFALSSQQRLYRNLAIDVGCGYTESQPNGVPCKYVVGLVEQESSFNPLAMNRDEDGDVADIGLMQLNVNYLKSLGFSPAEALDPAFNIRIGCKYLQHLYTRYGSIEDAIQAYNVGETNFDRGVRAPIHLQRVLERAENYELTK
jgi:soluble lytic murein transglycosylase-like protein